MLQIVGVHSNTAIGKGAFGAMMHLLVLHH